MDQATQKHSNFDNKRPSEPNGPLKHRNVKNDS